MHQAYRHAHWHKHSSVAVNRGHGLLTEPTSLLYTECSQRYSCAATENFQQLSIRLSIIALCRLLTVAAGGGGVIVNSNYYENATVAIVSIFE